MIREQMGYGNCYQVSLMLVLLVLRSGTANYHNIILVVVTIYQD